MSMVSFYWYNSTSRRRRCLGIMTFDEEELGIPYTSMEILWSSYYIIRKSKVAIQKEYFLVLKKLKNSKICWLGKVVL